VKLNLLMYSDNVMAGYTNLDPYPIFSNKGQAFSTEKVMGDVQNLDNIADDGECEKIRAMEVLDYVTLANKIPVIHNWMKKLQHGGILTVSGFDLYSISLSIKNGVLEGDEARLVLYGPPSFPFGVRQGLFTIEEVVNIFTASGLNILKKSVANYQYLVSGQRP